MLILKNFDTLILSQDVIESVPVSVERQIFLVWLSHTNSTEQYDVETVADGAVFTDFLTRAEHAILEHSVGLHAVFLTEAVPAMLGSLDLHLGSLIGIREHFDILAHEVVYLLVLFFRPIAVLF